MKCPFCDGYDYKTPGGFINHMVEHGWVENQSLMYYSEPWTLEVYTYCPVCEKLVLNTVICPLCGYCLDRNIRELAEKYKR